MSKGSISKKEKSDALKRHKNNEKKKKLTWEPREHSLPVLSFLFKDCFIQRLDMFPPFLFLNDKVVVSFPKFASLKDFLLFQ
jgi:hypothetical protein